MADGAGHDNTRAPSEEQQSQEVGADFGEVGCVKGSASLGDARRIAEIRGLVTAWISDSSLPDNTIPASPDDVFWLCDQAERPSHLDRANANEVEIQRLKDALRRIEAVRAFHISAEVTEMRRIAREALAAKRGT